MAERIGGEGKGLGKGRECPCAGAEQNRVGGSTDPNLYTVRMYVYSNPPRFPNCMLIQTVIATK